MTNSLFDIIKSRILVLDGAMGTMIQRLKLQEDDFRGTHFRDHPVPLKGNNDLLSVTKPEVILNIHREYLRAGADLITTNTFNANRISLADYRMEDQVYGINRRSAELAVSAIREATLQLGLLALQTARLQCRQTLMTREPGPFLSTSWLMLMLNRPGAL